MSWKPSVELRFVTRYEDVTSDVARGINILQQKWFEYKSVRVSTAPGTEGDVTMIKTDEFEWRDVALVEAKDELVD